MSGKIWRISTCIFIILVLATFVGSCSINKPETPETPVPVNVPAQAAEKTERSEYRINAVLDAANKVLTAEQQIRYVNTESVELTELYFHVYTNAFKQKETAPFLFDDFERAYSRGFQPGYTEFAEVAQADGQNRKSLEYSLQGTGDTILKVKLAEPLKPRNAVTLELKYKVVIPPAGERFGYGEKNINMGNWYPVAAVYDADGWNLDKYYSIGDPFYSDTANYDVTLKAPKEYMIAASGELKEEKGEGNLNSWHFTSGNMRDFAFIASNAFSIAEEKVGETLIRSYYYKDHETKGKAALEYGKSAIAIFNRSFGIYPYPTFSIVETEFPSGMEYPGLVYINTKYYDNENSEDNLLYTTVHETAHQWWYGVVGNDQIDEAWLDEGFATYSEGVFTEKEYGKGNGDMYYEYIEQDAMRDTKSKVYDGVILKSLSSYTNWDDYGPAVYTGGAALLCEIRREVGDEKFYKILQEYYEKYAFKNATTEDFLSVCEEVSGKQFDDLFTKRLGSLN
ncbi:MAG TPA: M1 family metallopeptidase [Negativicutes bacterium]|nr:M1 family metallopeptidase [Negativicutes bacterium]